MRVAASNGLVYDDSNPLCSMEVSRSQGENYAFITVIEEKWPDHTKRYWGRFDFDDKEGSLIEIMETGGKWPDLPA